MKTIKPEFIEFQTKDGITLPGLLYRKKKEKTAVIYLHGNGSSSVFYDETKNRVLALALTKKIFPLYISIIAARTLSRNCM